MLFLTHVGQPGGAEFVMIHLCEAVRDYCSVLHFQHGPIEQILQNRGISSSVLPMPEALTGLKRSGGWSSLLKTIPDVLSMIRSLVRAEKEADIIVCMSQKSFILAALAKLFNRKPIIWFMNDLISKDHFSSALIFVMTKVFAPFANHIVVNSQSSYQSWGDAGGNMDKLIVIYPGSDVERIEQQCANRPQVDAYRQKFSPDNAPLIGIFGRICHWKGQDVFLEALTEIPFARGVIVGDAYFGEDEYFKSLQDYVAQNGLTDRVVFAGHLHDVPTAMAACDVVVHASTDPEPFGLVIVEAMLSNVPVVVSDAGGAREIVMENETGFRTKPGDAHALAEAIVTYLNNPQDTSARVRKANARAKLYFTNASMIQAFKDLVIKTRVK
jgi:glycosyltransferase involved in cell wall biosynthesis